MTTLECCWPPDDCSLLFCSDVDVVVCFDVDDVDDVDDVVFSMDDVVLVVDDDDLSVLDVLSVSFLEITMIAEDAVVGGCSMFRAEQSLCLLDSRCTK